MRFNSAVIDNLVIVQLVKLHGMTILYLHQMNLSY